MATDRSSDARDRAEARFEKKAKAVRESDAARADYATASRAVDEKTARLKSLRLAKEAEDADASQRAITPKKKK